LIRGSNAFRKRRPDGRTPPGQASPPRAIQNAGVPGAGPGRLRSPGRGHFATRLLLALPAMAFPNTSSSTPAAPESARGDSVQHPGRSRGTRWPRGRPFAVEGENLPAIPPRSRDHDSPAPFPAGARPSLPAHGRIGRRRQCIEDLAGTMCSDPASSTTRSSAWAPRVSPRFPREAVRALLDHRRHFGRRTWLALPPEAADEAQSHPLGSSSPEWSNPPTAWRKVSDSALRTWIGVDDGEAIVLRARPRQDPPDRTVGDVPELPAFSPDISIGNPRDPLQR